MIIKIGKYDYTEVWDGVLYKKLSNYPQISDWEIRTIIDFIDYENMYGRKCQLICDDKQLLQTIEKSILEKEKFQSVPVPEKITECIACRYRKGCCTKFVCHTTSLENALKILRSGCLLSALRARKLTVNELMAEKRNAANDPADYFEYIMFTWGNCQAGDRLVMERKLDRFPTEQDLSRDFTPGVRFYFRYEDLIRHPNVVFDGVLPLKIRDELGLKDWCLAVIVPAEWKQNIEQEVPDYLSDKIIYLENDCEDIWDWSEKVYQKIEAMDQLNIMVE